MVKIWPEYLYFLFCLISLRTEDNAEIHTHNRFFWINGRYGDINKINQIKYILDVDSMDFNVYFITLVYPFVLRVYEWFVIKKLLRLSQIYNTSSLIVFCKL